MRTNSIKTYFILLCLLITAGNTVHAFTSDPLFKSNSFSEADTIIKAKPVMKKDTTSKNDTIIVGDTIAKTISKPFLDDKVDYKADDSMITDLTNQKAYLYNNAVVLYQEMTLKAGYIEIDFKNNIVYAFSLKDSLGKETQRPDFTNKDGKYVAGYIAYNFETKKGKIKDVITQQDEGYIHGRDIKKDTGDVYYVSHGKYTTCELEQPHYYIAAEKIKVIPDDKIITGPAVLYIADIPTPLVLPFGYFPNKKGRRSGILIPSYGESANWGFFLKDGGFYFGGNEYIDLALTGDIYANGTFGGAARTNYRKRYKFDGGLNVSYSRNIEGDFELPNSTVQNNFFIRWNHIQDAKAHPNSRFSADVNAGSSKYNQYNGNVTGDYLQNTFLSNISYSKTFAGTPFNFGANLRHSQNTITKKMDITFPELSLSMNRIYPLKNKKRITNKWYDKIGVSATANARNDINTYDSLLFTNSTLQNMRNGVRLTAPISTSFNLFKYITVTPQINTASNIYFESIRQRFDVDSGRVIIDTIPGAVMANDFSVSTSLSTRLYGDYFFRTKRLKQIRHVASPTISASYHPDFSENRYGYYKEIPIDPTQTPTTVPTPKYSIFQNGIYGSPAAGLSQLISFGLNNTIDAKRKSVSDSGDVFNKVSLIDNLGASCSFNIAAKSFNWSNINVNGRTRLFKIFDITAVGILSPYQLDTTDGAPIGRQIDRFEWNNGKIGRFTSGTISLSTGLRSKEKTGASTTSPKATQDQLDYIKSHPEAYVDFSIPWSLNFLYNVSYSRPGFDSTQVVSQSLTFFGDLSLTEKWKISLTSGYDFTSKKITLTSINVYRDLHCWEMHFNWVPFGFRQSFSIDINVKASVLKDLKLSRRKGWQDYQ